MIPSSVSSEYLVCYGRAHSPELLLLYMSNGSVCADVLPESSGNLFSKITRLVDATEGVQFICQAGLCYRGET